MSILSDTITIQTVPPLPIKASRPVAIIVTAVGEYGQELFQKYGHSVAAYARRIDCDLHIIDGPPLNELCPIADKFRVASYLDYYERIIALDADIHISSDAFNLFEVVPEDYMAFCDETFYSMPDGVFTSAHEEISQIQKLLGFDPVPPVGYLNSGLVVASKQHREILSPPLHAIPNWFRCDQAIINARIIQSKTKVIRLGPEAVWLWFANQDRDPIAKNLAKFHHYAGFHSASQQTAVHHHQTGHKYLIAALIQLIGAKTYLELGFGDGDNLWHQIGANPQLNITCVDKSFTQEARINGATAIAATTDAYFANLSSKKQFDLIFIDANHEAEQVARDFANSLKHLRENGLILLHDTHPASRQWTAANKCGTAYLFAARLPQEHPTCEAITLPYHPGLTIVRKRHRHVPWM